MSVKPSLLAATVAFLIICQPSSRNRGGAPGSPPNRKDLDYPTATRGRSR